MDLSSQTMRSQKQNILASELSQAKHKIHFDEADKVAKEWWESLEALNKDQLHLVLKLAKELEYRGVGINEFFEVWLHSQLEDVEANLHQLDKLIQDRAVKPKQKRARLRNNSLDTTKVLKDKVIYKPAKTIVH